MIDELNMRLIEVILHDSVDIDTGNIDFFDSWRTFLRSEHNRFGRFPADTPVCHHHFECSIVDYPYCRPSHPVQLFLAHAGNLTPAGRGLVRRLSPYFPLVHGTELREMLRCVHCDSFPSRRSAKADTPNAL